MFEAIPLSPVPAPNVDVAPNNDLVLCNLFSFSFLSSLSLASATCVVGIVTSSVLGSSGFTSSLGLTVKPAGGDR